MEYLDDPSVLTKDKLKSELLAHNVELPSGNPTKDVYVQLYLKKLTAHKQQQHDVFSSDEELPPPVVFSRSRSSGRKATRKTDKVRPDEMDVTMLSDQGLKDELLKHGVDVGPIVATTRKLYEKKLQRMLDDGPAQPPKLLLSETQVTLNGNAESDLYSDKEDEVTAEPEPEPVAEPEPVPVVERPVRSRGKTPITTRTRSSQHRTLKVEDVGLSLPKPGQESSQQPAALLNSAALQEPETRTEPLRPALAGSLTKQSSRPSSPLAQVTKVGPASFSPFYNISPIKKPQYHWSLSGQFGSKAGGVSAARVEKIAASEQTQKVEEKDVLKELFPNDINSPTGISATCRRPIRGAARRPLTTSDLWNHENRLFSPKTTKTSSSSSYTESCTVNKVSSLPPPTFSSSSFSSSSRLLSAAPPAGPTRAAYRSVSLWIKLFLLAIVAAFLFLVYQAMETNTNSPFSSPDTGVASGSTA